MEKSEQLYFEMPNLRLLGIQDYIITNSNNLAFDLMGRGPLDAIVDFGKFLFQNR